MTSEIHAVKGRCPSPALCGAVVVTFNPEVPPEALFRKLAGQAQLVLVVDNSTQAASRERIRDAALRTGAEYLAQDSNKGVAGALNSGFALLHSRGYSHGISFDQDSTPASDLCHRLMAHCSQHDELAVLGADWQDVGTPDRKTLHVTPHPWLPFLFRRRPVDAKAQAPVAVSFCIMSGSCFSLSIWKQLGGFDERLMLDLVDQDFCLRASRLGTKVALLPGARLEHHRGHKRPVHRFGVDWTPSFMSPHRLSCMFQNRVRLLFPWLVRHPHMAVHELAYSAKILFDVCFLEDRSGAKLAGILRGITRALLRRPLRL